MGCDSLMTNGKPLLSICIPTYNRAEHLRAALYSIVRQSNQFDDYVEVLVSDNCSSDHTVEVVEWARQYGKIEYHCNPNNVGAGRNFIQLAQVLAKGDFCWLLGDDDLLQKGAVESVLNAFAVHPDLDYIFVNSSYRSESHREPAFTESPQFLPGAKNMCSEEENKMLQRWEDLISLSQESSLFTFIGNHILRTSLWRQVKFGFKSDAGFPNLEATFPHAYAVAMQMIGKPAYYIGYPYIIEFYGSQEWFSYWPMIHIVRVMELSDLLSDRGAERSMVRRYRNLILKGSSQYFWRLVIDHNAPGRNCFNSRKLITNYWMYSGFWHMILYDPWNRYMKPMFSYIKRGIRRVLKGQLLRQRRSA